MEDMCWCGLSSPSGIGHGATMTTFIPAARPALMMVHPHMTSALRVSLGPKEDEVRDVAVCTQGWGGCKVWKSYVDGP